MISGSNTIPVILFRQVVDAMWKLKPRGGTTLCLAAALGCSVSFMEWIKEERADESSELANWLLASSWSMESLDSLRYVVVRVNTISI